MLLATIEKTMTAIADESEFDSCKNVLGSKMIHRDNKLSFPACPIPGRPTIFILLTATRTGVSS